MRKFMSLVMGMMMAATAFSQKTVQTWPEDFDGTVTFSAIPQGSWIADPAYYLPGSSTTNPQSYWAAVPNALGGTVILETDEYDCTNMTYIVLKFSHICKISPKDTVLIQYREANTANWKDLPVSTYQGKATNFNRGFSAASYSDWKAGDSTALPQQSWWKEETFDLSTDLQHGKFTLRFVIKRGQVQGTQVSYGWLLENFSLVAASYQMYPPTVKLINPLISRTVYKSGPHEINARVKTNTSASIETPKLAYSATSGGNSVEDTVLMTAVKGDSLWKATIPQFILGTTVRYSVIGRDTNGNEATDTSSYVIAALAGGSGNVIVQDGSTSYGNYPFVHNYGYSRSMSLYTAAEMNGMVVGGIRSIALRVQAAGTGAFPMKVWLKTVPASKTTWNTTADSYEWSVATQDATLVYDGLFHFDATGWVDIPLNQVFMYNGTDNLVVMFEQNCDGYSCGSYMSSPYSQYYYSTSATDKFWYRRWDNDPNGSGTLSVSYFRPDLRIELGSPASNNAASMASIDINDTVLISSGATIPVVAAVRNEGYQNLGSVRFSYSVNGRSVTNRTETFSPAVLWDYTAQRSIGSYTPKINGYDTIKIWVSLPNGQNDPTKWDDTLTKIIYGSGDLVLEFVNYPADTVNHTGPFAIDARIFSRTGATVPPVFLQVDTTSTGTPTSFTLPMTFDANADLYKTQIPHTLLGSNVKYSISLTDIRSNVVKIEKRFHIRRPTIARDTNAVALVAINTPGEGGQLAAHTVPLQVTIRNTGVMDLDSCVIVWILNSDTQSVYMYRGKLPEDFTELVTIDNYTPVLGQRDTIEVRVSMPDDTEGNYDMRQIMVLGCAGDLYGEKLIDSTIGDFVSIADALTAIRECNLADDLTLLLKGVYKENINLSDFTPYLRGYHLTITSVDNHADSAVIQPLSGAGITLRNIKDITIKAITIDNTTRTASGIQFTGACSNIVIRDNKILTDPTATATSVSAAPIYKGLGTGIVDNIRIIHNILDGSHAGFFFYGGTGTSNGQYGTRIVFDSNTLSNNYLYGMRVLYTDFSHVSHNTIQSRDANSTQRWDGLSLNSVNGDIIGNHITQKNPTVESDLINLQYYNYHNTTKRGLVANNEVIYQSSAKKGTGIYTNYVNMNFLHNSFYMSSTGQLNGLYLEAVNNSNMTIKNNNIVTLSATDGNLFLYTGTTAMNQYEIDYNNFYTTQSRIGTFSTTQIPTVAQLQQYFPTAQHMVSTLPIYVDISTNADLMASNLGMYCPILPSVTDDIEGKPRLGQAAMGAYQISVSAHDLGINQILSWNTEAVKDQIVSIDVEIQNMGSSDIQNAVLRWSLNGQPQGATTWTPAPSAPFLEKDTVNMGSFTVANTDVYKIVVWVESVNGSTDMYHRNDTLRATTTKMLLVEWVEPLKGATNTNLTFDIAAKIRTATGAPTTPPELYMVTIIDDKYTEYDTLPMTLDDDDIWRATVPQRYYKSKITYSLTVSDTISITNTSTIIDSVYIQYVEGRHKTETIIIGTGTSTTNYNPYNYNYNYSYTRNYYMSYEINATKRGGVISNIAFYNTSTGTSNVDNVSFYMKAVSDSVIATQAYVDPVADGATLVWGPATSTFTGAGWKVFTLDTAFTLPPNMNLLIYCNDQDGVWSGNGAANWQYTPAQGKSFYAYGDISWPPTTYTGTTGRPNLRIIMPPIMSPYTGNNLALTNMLAPVTDVENYCTPDYSPVQVNLRNLGEHDYDFTQNSLKVYLEITNPLGRVQNVSFTIDTGMLASMESSTLNLMSAYPIMYAGSYDIKAWIESSIDDITYDDTLYYVYISGRIGLPVDIDFSAATLPSQVIANTVIGDRIWTPYTPAATEPVQPNVGNGTGVLRFDGAFGAMTTLRTRQLDLFGSDDPQLEFWYYHDTALPVTDKSYLDVNAVVGGVSINLAQLLLRSTEHGWKYYNIPLTQFTTTSQCFLIQFEAMNKLGGRYQYIDRIRITAKQDIAVKEVIVSNSSACDMQNNAWGVVLQNLADPALDYTLNPTKVTLEIVGTSYTFEKSLSSGLLSGYALDTIILDPKMNFAAGTYNVRAYFSTTLVQNPLNDTLKTNVVVKPDMNIEVHNVSTVSTPLHAGLPLNQEVTVTNTGNLELPNVKLIMRLLDGSGFTDTISLGRSLLPDSSVRIAFTKAYRVPWLTTPYYQVEVYAFLECNPTLLNKTASAQEYINKTDLSIEEITNPIQGTVDHVGDNINVSLRILNGNPGKSYNEGDAKAGILIKDENGNLISSVALEDLPSIEGGSDVTYTFSRPYTVPTQTRYLLAVYITSEGDEYFDNDTAKDTRSTDYVGILDRTKVSFTMEQNIPNPAKESTLINYSIPQDGEIVFHVYSVSGQLLYTKKENVSFGDHQIELNLSDYAAGIYFYSMEYNGQRLVKRMSIKR